MSEANVIEVSAPSAPASHAARTDIISVDSSNFGKFVDEKMGVVPNDSPEAIAAKDLEKIEVKKAEDEAEKKAEDDPTHDAHELGEEKKRGINERFSKLSAAKRAAEESAVKATADAQKATERIAQLENEAKELRALKDKYEPVKTEADPKPQPTNFNDINEYSKALEDWTKEATKIQLAKEAKESSAKSAYEAAAKSWQDRQSSFKTENPEYADTIANADLQIYNACGEAIMESDVGPHILYHLAKSPELVAKMKGMSIQRALVEVGKLEAKFSNDTSTAAPVTNIAEISKAPAPITPIKGGSGIEGTKIGTYGEWQGTYADYKKARLAGKIK